MTSYYHYDGQLSTRQLTDALANVTDGYTYDAFGILLNMFGATENDYLYTGEQYDPNVGFYYLRARYYNQSMGRFLTSDPFEGYEFEPYTFHKYLYAGNNPINYQDPSGLFWNLGTAVMVTAIMGAAISAAIYLNFYCPSGAEGYRFTWAGYTFWIASGAAIGAVVGYLGTYAWIYLLHGGMITINLGGGLKQRVSYELVKRWPSANYLKDHFFKHAGEFKNIHYSYIQQYAADATYIANNYQLSKQIGNTSYYVRWIGTYNGKSLFGFVVEKGGKFVSYRPFSLSKLVKMFPELIQKGSGG